MKLTAQVTRLDVNNNNNNNTEMSTSADTIQCYQTVAAISLYCLWNKPTANEISQKITYLQCKYIDIVYIYHEVNALSFRKVLHLSIHSTRQPQETTVMNGKQVITRHTWTDGGICRLGDRALSHILLDLSPSTTSTGIGDRIGTTRSSMFGITKTR